MKNKLARRFLAVFIIIAMVAAAGCSAPATAGNGEAKPQEAQQPQEQPTGEVQHYSFVSSNPGGTWYNMVGGATALFNEKIPGVNFAIEATGGSVENVRRVLTGEAEFGLAYASHLYEAFQGMGNYKGNTKKTITALCEVFSSPHYFVALKDSGIKTLSDLAGKKVALGAPGSGTSDNSRRVFETLGIKVDGVELSFADAAQAMQDGQIDALGQGGAPAAGVVELAASKDIVIIPFSDEELDEFVKLAPYYEKGELPANTYTGQDKPVPTFFFSVYWIAHQDAPEDLVENMLKTAFDPEGLKYLSEVHPQWKTLRDNPEGLEMIGVPYHPGAKKYWNK